VVVVGQVLGGEDVAENGGKNRYLGRCRPTSRSRCAQPAVSGANDPSVGRHDPIGSKLETSNHVYSNSACCNEHREGASLELPFTRRNNCTVSRHLLKYRQHTQRGAARGAR
jgi:hypothetical protein